MKLMDATSAGVSSPWGEKEMPGHVVPTYNIPTIMIVDSTSMDCDYVT